MPSFSGTPARILWNGGDATFIPPRFSADAGRIRWHGGSALFSLGNTVAAPILDRLFALDRLFNADGTPDPRFMSIWQSTMTAIEDAFTSLVEQVNNNTQAIALAQAANANATTATDILAMGLGYITGDVLSASNDGTVTIQEHTRYYGNKTSVTVNAGAIGGFSAGDYVTVFYKDAARKGGAVTYQGTISAVAQQGSTHVIGQVPIPASGEPPVSGTSTSAPGYTPPTGSATYDPDYIEP